MLSDASPIVLRCFCVVFNVVGHIILIHSVVGPCAACLELASTLKTTPMHSDSSIWDQLSIGDEIADEMDEYRYTGPEDIKKFYLVKITSVSCKRLTISLGSVVSILLDARSQTASGGPLSTKTSPGISRRAISVRSDWSTKLSYCLL